MEQGRRRLVPKVLGGLTRHPRLMTESSEAHNTCATVLYRSQRQAQLQQKAQAAHVDAPVASSYTHASVTSVLDRPPDYSQSAAEAHRRRRLAQKEMSHEHAPLATPPLLLPTSFFAGLASEQSSKLLLGGLAVAMTAAAAAPFVMGEEVAGGGAGATQAQGAVGRAAGSGTPESQQPLWLQRPRQG